MAGSDTLADEIESIANLAKAQAVGVSWYDYNTNVSWQLNGDRWFHAASTIKVAILVAVFGVIEEGYCTLDTRVHVRNRFISVSDGSPYKVSSSRDANSQVYAAIGKTLTVHDLLHHMIVTSSNLATNV